MGRPGLGEGLDFELGVAHGSMEICSVLEWKQRLVYISDGEDNLSVLLEKHFVRNLKTGLIKVTSAGAKKLGEGLNLGSEVLRSEDHVVMRQVRLILERQYSCCRISLATLGSVMRLEN